MKIITVILFVFLIPSCSLVNDDKRVSVLDYSIGDALVNNYDTIKTLDQPFIVTHDTRDTRLKFRLIDKYIYEINYQNLSEREIEGFKVEIIEKLKHKPTYQKDIMVSGVLFYGENYEWYDSISKDRILIFIPRINGEKLKGSLSIYNEEIYKNLRRKYDPVFYSDSIMTVERIDTDKI